ncbi:MAG: SCO family protein [Acidiferrobacterales bacterium]
MSLSKILALGFGFTLLTGVATAALAHSLKSVEDQLRQDERYMELMNQPAPDFTLEDAYGRKVSLSDFAGKVVVLNFVYARCKDECPLHSRFIASIQNQINQTLMREQVQFISISTDTEDAQATAAAMRGYAKQHDLDPANWVLLYRGSRQPDLGIALARAYGLTFTPTAEGDQMHGVVTFLIDQDGVLRARYHGLKFNPVNLIIHAGALLHGEHGEASSEVVAQSGQSDHDAETKRVGWMTWVWAAIALISLGLLVFGGISLYRTLKTG